MKKPRLLRVLTATTTACLLALTACGGGISEPGSSDGASARQTQGAAADATVLRYTTQHTENTPFSRALEIWADRLREETDGRVSIEVYYSGSLLPAAESLPGIMDGRADAGYVVDTMFPDLLPLTISSSIPFDRTNGIAQAKAYLELYNENASFQAEYEALGVHVLLFQPMGATLIGTREPVNGLSDLQGKSIRCIGYICDSLSAVGANPVAIASNEIYEAMDRRTIDGWSAYPFMDILATQFQEVTPYITDPGIGQYVQGVFPINKNSWDAISEEDQQIMTDLVDEYYEIMAEEMNALEKQTCAATTEAGVTLSAFSDEDTATWRDQVHDSVYEGWVSQAGSTSDDPEGFYSDLMAAYESALAETDFESWYGDCMSGDLA